MGRRKDPAPSPSIVVTLACHNRREATLSCLDALAHSLKNAGVGFSAVLVDDGSTDGTGDAVVDRFSGVQLLRSDGSLFWNRSMHLAQQVAIKSEPDFLLWLNDDTILLPESISKLLSTHAHMKSLRSIDTVVVGATADRMTGVLTYGGLVSRSYVRRFNFTRLPAAATPQECDAMNGNIVLVPRRVYIEVGLLDPLYEHAYGDIDYALRARRVGFKLIVAPGIMGYCSANPSSGSYSDSGLPFRRRWALFRSRKVLPAASWLHFVRRHAFWAWPFYFALPYVNFAIRLLRDGLRKGSRDRFVRFFH